MPKTQLFYAGFPATEEFIDQFAKDRGIWDEGLRSHPNGNYEGVVSGIRTFARAQLLSEADLWLDTRNEYRVRFHQVDRKNGETIQIIAVGDNKSEENMKMSPADKIERLRALLGMAENAKPKWYIASDQNELYDP